MNLLSFIKNFFAKRAGARKLRQVTRVGDTWPVSFQEVVTVTYICDDYVEVVEAQTGFYKSISWNDAFAALEKYNARNYIEHHILKSSPWCPPCTPHPDEGEDEEEETIS